MSVSVVVLFFVTGCVGGFVAGFMGVGGGILFVPCLHMGFTWMGIEPNTAFMLSIGTSLAIIVVTSFSSALGHAIHGSLTGGQILSMAILAVPASVVGAGIAQVIGGGLLQRFFGLFLFFVSYKFLTPSPKSKVDPDRMIPVTDLMMVGAASGLMSSLLGVGGGIVTVTLLNLVLRVPIHRAVANSSGLIVFTTIAGTLSWVYSGWNMAGLPKFSYGYVNIVAWAAIALSAVAFAQVGAWVASRVKPENLRKPFGVILILVGIKMMFFPPTRRADELSAAENVPSVAVSMVKNHNVLIPPPRELERFSGLN